MSLERVPEPGLETGLLLVFLCTVLIGGLLFGSFAIILTVIILCVQKFLSGGRKVTVILLMTGMLLLFFFGRTAEDLYWQTRFDLIWQALSTPDGISVWALDLNICVESLAGALLLAAFISLAFELWSLSPYRRLLKRQEEDQHMQAIPLWTKWTLEKVNKRSAFSQINHTVLGVIKKSGRALTVPDQSLNTHMLILGTTGSGKTVSLLNFVESFIGRHLPVIFIDGKGDYELAQQIVSYANVHNRKSWLFSMSGASCVYDPLSGDYTALKDKIIALRRHWSEEHYLKLAEGYLQMVFKVLQATSQKVSLQSVTAQFDIALLMRLVREAEKEGRLSTHSAQDLMNEINAQKEAAKHIESLRAELSNLASSSLAPLFDTTSTKGAGSILRLKDVLSQNGVATLVLHPLAYPEVSGVIGRLILNDLKTCLDPQNPKKVLLVIDEISTLISTQFLNYLNQGRYLGLHIILTAQSVADLGQKIPENAMLFIRQILANCNVYVIHKINDYDDAHYLASVLGTSLEIDYTAEVSSFGTHSGEGSARLVHEFLVHPDQIKSLKRGEGFFCDKNSEGQVEAFLGRKGKLVT